MLTHDTDIMRAAIVAGIVVAGIALAWWLA